MKRFAGLLLGLAGVGGCAARATPPCVLAPKAALSASPAPPRSALPAATPLGYAVSPFGLVESAGNLGMARLERLAPRAANDDGGFLVQGVRFRVDGPGRIHTAQEGPVVDGVRVPARFGGGFLFSSGPSLFLAKDFLAALQPFFFADSSGIQRVSFGPSFVLVRAASGQAWSLSLPQARPVALPLTGLLDVASLDDGRALALLEDGRARVLRGAAWLPLSASAASLPFTQVEEDGQSLWLVDSRGARWGLGPQSTLERVPTVPEAYPQDMRLDPRAIGLEIPKDWPLQQTPLERAIAGGVMLDERMALVEAAGRFVKIDTRLGTLLASSEQVVSADFDQGAPNACQLHRVGTELVGVCSWWRSSVVVEDAASAAPRVRFDYFGERKFVAGPDLLYSVGPCASDRSKPGVICVREPGHDWVERELAALPPPAGATATAEADTDVDTGADTAADSEADTDTDGTPAPATEPAQTPELWTSTEAGSPAVVFQVNGQHYFVELANRVARWLPVDNPSACLGCGLDGAIDRRFHINARGRLVDGMPQQLIAANGGLLQRNDGVSSFHAIDPPPLEVPESDAPPCSEVGCRSGALLRLGWDTRARATSHAPLPRVQGASWLSAEQARLGCERQGEPSPVALNPSVRRAEPMPSKAPVRDWFWHTPSIRLGVAGPAKEPASATQTRLAFLDGLPAVAVSDLRRFDAVGLLASDFRTGVWHAYQDGRFKSYQPRRAPDRFPAPIAATRLPNGDLAVLSHDTDSRLSRVGVWTGDKSKATWAVPLMPESQLQSQEDRESPGIAPASETLALGPGNELAILRLPRGAGVVAGAAGALLLREKSDISVLAAWSSLQSGASAACAKPAPEWRAVLQLAGPWLRLTGLGDSNLSLDRGSVTAAVRWRSDRVCVDWLQLGDVQLGSDLAGHFSEVLRPTLANSRGRGTDWRTVLQPLRCAPLVLPPGAP